MNSILVLERFKEKACFLCLTKVYGKNYYQPEHYVSKSVLQKMAMPCLKDELLRLHANNANMTAEEAEIEFLKVKFTSVLIDSPYGMIPHGSVNFTFI